MKDNKKIIQYILNINTVLFIFILCQCNYYIDKNKIIDFCKYDTYKNKKKYYKTKNKAYCNNILYSDTNLIIKKNQAVYSLIPYYSFSEIQISNNSLNLLNIYFNNHKKLIFNQLGLQFFNEKKIYNFGIGYRHCYCFNWGIGNNIFYDTTISQDGGKILSIGTEFFKNSIHITTNSYHDISTNNLARVKYKKYFPYAYDIRAKSPLPFLKKINGKINIEHYLSNKEYNFFSQESHTIKKYHSNGIYKLILGISYTPISTFSFNIDKTLFNSKQTYETKFNIIVHYKLSLPLIQQEKIYEYNNRHKNNNKKNFQTNINDLADRNNNNILFNHADSNLNKIKTSNLIQNYSKEIKLINDIILKKDNSYKKDQIQKDQLTKKQTSEIFELGENSYAIQIPCLNYATNKNNIFSSITYDIKNKSAKKNTSIIIIKPFNVPQTISDKSILCQTNNTSKNHQDSLNKNNNTLSDNEQNNNHNLQQTTLKNEGYNSNIFSERKSFQHNHNDQNNIPKPPPMSELPTTTINYAPSESYINSNNDHNHMRNIDEYKKKKFASLGTQEHLSKLNNITTKKREKTISTSSSASNNSEITTLLKIIERQSISITNNDTDSDDKDSTISTNEFSDN